MQHLCCSKSSRGDWKLWARLNHYVRGLTPSCVRDELTFCSLIFVTSREGNKATHLGTDSIQSHKMRTFLCFFFLLTLVLFILWKILCMYIMYLLRYLFLLFLFMFMYVSVWVNAACVQMLTEAKRGLPIPCSWSYEQLQAAQSGFQSSAIAANVISCESSSSSYNISWT